MFKQELSAKNTLVEYCKKNKIEIDDTLARQAVLADMDAMSHESVAMSIYNVTLLNWLLARQEVYAIEGDLLTYVEGKTSEGYLYHYSSAKYTTEHTTRYYEGRFFQHENIMQGENVKENYTTVVDLRNKKMFFVCLIADLVKDRNSLQQRLNESRRQQEQLVIERKKNDDIVGKHLVIIKELSGKLTNAASLENSLLVRLNEYANIIGETSEDTSTATQSQTARRFHFPWSD